MIFLLNHEQKVSEVTVREKKRVEGREKQQEARKNVVEKEEEQWRGWIKRVKGREEGGGKEKLEKMRVGEVNGREGGRREG